MVYLLLNEINSNYAKGFCLVLITYFFTIAMNIMVGIIGDMTAVFTNFNVQQEYVQIVVRLIGIVFYAEFVNFLLDESKLGNVGKMFEYLVKLYLIGYSLPMIIKLFEMILSIL
jgi:nanoRNase/pAp phosphatase (c-di-AMP/oligoRNAs hydrolase)